MSTQTVTQLPLSFREMRRDDLIGDGQGSQRRTSALLGDFTRTPYFAGEERTGVWMERSVSHIS
jgi:hypothetical protein